jgi:hypothetical protein
MHTLWDAGAGSVAPGSSVISAHWDPTWAQESYGAFVPRGAGGFPSSSSQYISHSRPYGAAAPAVEPMPDWFKPLIFLGVALTIYSAMSAQKR